MRRIFLAGLALPLLAMPAFSQSTTTSPATQPNTVNPAAPRTSQAMPPLPTPMPSTTAKPAPMVMPGTTSTTVPPLATTTPGTTMGVTPGANSFTESQARGRLTDQGYTAVSGLKKDKDGVWRGRATKDTKSMAVGVDYKGNISGG